MRDTKKTTGCTITLSNNMYGKLNSALLSTSIQMKYYLALSAIAFPIPIYSYTIFDRVPIELYDIDIDWWYNCMIVWYYYYYYWTRYKLTEISLILMKMFLKCCHSNVLKLNLIKKCCSMVDTILLVWKTGYSGWNFFYQK